MGRGHSPRAAGDERVGGEVVAMTPERVGHVQIKTRVGRRSTWAVRETGLACEALGDGVTVEVDEDTDYEPDALVNCGKALDPDAIAATNPVIVVEVLSPATAVVDAGGKLAGYFRAPSIRHYLIVHPRRREVIYHERKGDRIETRIVTSGQITMDPPRVAVRIEEFYPGHR